MNNAQNFGKTRFSEEFMQSVESGHCGTGSLLDAVRRQRREDNYRRNRQDLLEVRCCCKPQKLLGWLPKPDCWTGASIRLRPVSSTSVLDSHHEEYRITQTIVLPVTRISHSGIPSYLAIKAEGMELTDLIQISGFIPND